jgi:hypothetical protein
MRGSLNNTITPHIGGMRSAMERPPMSGSRTSRHVIRYERLASTYKAVVNLVYVMMRHGRESGKWFCVI